MERWLPLVAALVAACGESTVGAATDAGRDAEAAVAPDGGRSDGGGVPSVAKLFAFVGSGDGKIRTYAVDADGTWAPKKETAAGKAPSFLAFDPAKHRVVAVDEGNGLVQSFAFEVADGSLTPVSSKPAGGEGTTHVSLDPTGSWVFVANYTSGDASVRAIDSAGTLGDATDTKASGAKSHWVGTNPSGTHAFVVALGADHVAQYVLSAATGKLADNGTATLPSGTGPRHLAFHPSEQWAYTINEIAITATTFAFDKSTGRLNAIASVSAIPDAQSKTGVSGAEIVAHPNGKWVYASTRGYNSIALFSVDGATGKLTRISNTPTGGARPRSFAIDPDGTLLFAGNQDVNQVAGFRIDPSTGALTPFGQVTVPKPDFVGLARMP
jgi:6-phosphogluconolactonase